MIKHRHAFSIKILIMSGTSIFSAAFGYALATLNAPAATYIASEADTLATTSEAPSLLTACQSSDPPSQNITSTSAQTKTSGAGIGMEEIQPHLVEMLDTAAEVSLDGQDIPTMEPLAPHSTAEPSLPERANAKQTSLDDAALLHAHLDPEQVKRLSADLDELDSQRWELFKRADEENWENQTRVRAMLALESKEQQIRQSIGEQQFDQYMYAAGKANRVAIGEISEGTPAHLAGLRAGDIVLNYGDRPVYSTSDMRESQITGDTVRVTIKRQDQTLEMNLPRGPLGVALEAIYVDPNPARTATVNE